MDLKIYFSQAKESIFPLQAYLNKGINKIRLSKKSRRKLKYGNDKSINPLTSPSAGAPALKYGDVNTVNPSPGEVKGLI